MYRNTTICLTALLLAGCVTKEIQVVTNPINPTITVKGDQTAEVIRNSSGALIKLPSSKNNYIVEVRADGYETETRAIDPGTADPKVPITIDLEKIQDTRAFRFTSDPDGAYVAIDGTVLYKTTPVTAEVTFERPSKAAKWLPKEVTYSKDNWETQTVSLKIGDNENPPTAELKRLNHTIPVKIAATSSDGAPLPAAVTIDGKESGTTPITVPIPFSRSKGTDPWPSFKVRLGIADQYKFVEYTQSYDSPTERVSVLEPVTEVLVTRAFPVVRMSNMGAVIDWDTSARPGALDESESRLLRNLTGMERNDPRGRCIHSFTVTPDSQELIYAMSIMDDTGRRISNLWQSSAQSAELGRKQITEGPYLDSNPCIGITDASDALVFQSNRSGYPESFDIVKLRIEGKGVQPGITHLTRERQFNYAPTYIHKDLELYFSSLEYVSSIAKPQISYMGLDGSLPTYLSEYGVDIALSPDGKNVYFSQEDQQSKKLQIFRIPREGGTRDQPITRSAYMEANCFSPAISRDGQQMLFVSDIEKDTMGRPNNNIFLMDLQTGDIMQITENLSDDLHPVWSPSESNVVFFLSNRGGAYNVWRMELD